MVLFDYRKGVAVLLRLPRARSFHRKQRPDQARSAEAPETARLESCLTSAGDPALRPEMLPRRATCHIWQRIRIFGNASLRPPAVVGDLGDPEGLHDLRHLLALAKPHVGVAGLPNDLFRLESLLGHNLSPSGNGSTPTLPLDQSLGEGDQRVPGPMFAPT